jgi:predicted phosphohydrolase
MGGSLRIAITADLHYGGARGRGDEATRLLAGFLNDQPPDVLILAGDIGTQDHFDRCLGLFANLPGLKALVPGNHDIWVESADPRGDSLRVYSEHLPQVSAAHGFHYLDGGPLLLPQAGLALVGSINWYDYSWSIDQLREHCPEWEELLREMRFPHGGRHNDRRFVHWPLDDVRFTAEVVTAFERHLCEALAQVDKAIVVTHHPPFFVRSVPSQPDEPPDIDRLLWQAFSGNRSMEEILTRHAERIPFAFCGHTHRARENTLGAIRGYNVGGDYHFKRLLLLDWPAGNVEAHIFGDPDGK